VRQNVDVTNVFSLDRPVYGIAQAAQLLGLRPDRARAWLDGYTRSGTHYPPVVRDVTTKSDLVTWGEFVELGYLRGYRQAAVALQRIRPVIARLRKEYHTPYPLAYYRPWVYDKELVLEAQEAEGLPSSLAIVVRTGQEIMLSDVAKGFMRRVEFDGDTARRWLPLGEFSPVVVDPSVAFGMPNVDGISTERLYELVVAGESLSEVANGYDISIDLLKNACAYEEMARRLAA